MTRRLDGTDADALDAAAAILRRGGLVAFPTETVYGLGADGLDADAVARIFAAKGRPADNPLILHVAGVDDALALWDVDADTAARVRRIAEAFWPGPLTLVLPAAATVPSIVTAGLDSVAVRMPDHPVAAELIRRTGRPLAAPSANASGRPSPTSADHVLRTLDGRIDAVVDGGDTLVGVESTVLDLRGETPRILRAGDVGADELAAVLGTVDEGRDADGPARSPGMRHRHYAPEGLAVRLASAVELDAAWASDAAILCLEPTAMALEAAHGPRRAPLEILPDAPRACARALYGALYRLEASGADTLLLEPVPDVAAWRAVRDRLERAAAG
jgi:L-threonylcarbamoyladenylate synthase